MKPNPRGITCLIISLWLALAACGAWAQDMEYTPKVSDFAGMEAEEILETRVTLNFREADLQDILRLIAVKSKLNIIMNPSQVSGKVTLRLENVKLGVALDNILRVNGLAYIPPSERNDNIVRIVTADKVSVSDIETVTKTFQINWVDADLVASAIQMFLSEGSGKVYAETNSQTVTIVDVPERIDEAAALIEIIDKPERQVLIEARLVDMKVDAFRGLGLDMDLFQSDNSDLSRVTNSTNNWRTYDDRIDIPVDQLAMSFADTNAPTQLALGHALGGIFGQDLNIDLLITASESRGIIETLANPRLMTINNVPADIDLVEQVPWQETGQTEAGTSNDINTEDIGVKISVTPSITPNDFVRLEVSTEQRINNGRVDAGALAPLLVDERKANTNVIVKSGETALIGGLRQMNISDETEGTPWFHRIPVLGWFFKGKSNSQVKTELCLFVTPHVIKTPTLTTKEKAYYDRIDTKWDLPDYFFDDVKVDEDMD